MHDKAVRAAAHRVLDNLVDQISNNPSLRNSGKVEIRDVRLRSRFNVSEQKHFVSADASVRVSFWASEVVDFSGEPTTVKAKY